MGKQAQRQAQHPHHFEPRPEAVLHPGKLLRSDILGGIVGDAVAQGGEGGDDQVVELDRCRVAGNHTGPKAINHALNHNIANGDKTLLQNTWYGDNSNLF